MDEIKLERFKYAIFIQLSEELIDEYWNTIDVEFSAHTVIGFTLRTVLSSLGRLLKEKRVEYPATWWDAFKLEVLPYWIRKRMKINYNFKTLTARECFPKIPVIGHESVIYYEVS
jgi:hypothetical protein